MSSYLSLDSESLELLGCDLLHGYKENPEGETKYVVQEDYGCYFLSKKGYKIKVFEYDEKECMLLETMTLFFPITDDDNFRHTWAERKEFIQNMINEYELPFSWGCDFCHKPAIRDKLTLLNWHDEETRWACQACLPHN